MDDVCSAVDDDDEKSNLVRSSLKVLTTSHLSIRGWLELTSDLNSDKQEGVSLSAALLYLFEGAIPLITAFCSEFNRLRSSGPVSEKFSKLLNEEKSGKICCFASSFQVLKAHIDLGFSC